VANGKRRPVKAPGELGELIDAMLSHAPEDRPTVYELGKELSSLPNNKSRTTLSLDSIPGGPARNP
jgi:hypothetical protein